MHQDELKKLLTDIAAERLALLQRHEAAARVVSHYDFNNTYQYVISREETHVQWLQSACAEFGAALPAPSAGAIEPVAPKSPLPSCQRLIASRRANACWSANSRIAPATSRWLPR